MGSQVRILSIRLAWEYRFPWISPGREDARAVRPAAPAGGINTSVTTGKKGRRALANAGIQAPSGVQAPDVHSEASHPSFGWRTIRHRRATYPKKARPCGCGAVVARLLPKQETAGSNPVASAKESASDTVCGFLFAVLAQWSVLQSSKLMMRVRFPYTARYDSMPVGSSRRGSHDHAGRVRWSTPPFVRRTRGPSSAPIIL